jgi:hypothetical protein
LEKPEYLLGEQIRFWVGVDIEPGVIVPEDRRKPCSLTIRTPDGEVEKQVISWPSDGMVGAGWIGGSGLTPSGPGTLVLMMECGEQRTSPVELIVRESELIHQLATDFKFQKTGTVNQSDSILVTLIVSNNSPHIIQFPSRGVMMEGVSVDVLRRQPQSETQLFYPWGRAYAISDFFR